MQLIIRKDYALVAAGEASTPLCELQEFANPLISLLLSTDSALAFVTEQIRNEVNDTSTCITERSTPCTACRH